jgi:hypothetical protein
MLSLLRLLHVLSVALWFGSVAFFTFAGLLIFQAFAEVSALPADERPLWLPLPKAFDRPPPGEGFPEPLRLEQGSNAAGVAVSKIFPFYYALQAGCGVVAMLTALALDRSARGRHDLRKVLCVVALFTVLIGWWVEMHVSNLRTLRNVTTTQLLTDASPTAEVVATAREARASFGRWHGYSLLQNFATLGAVTLLTLLIPGASTTRESAAPPGA